MTDSGQASDWVLRDDQAVQWFMASFVAGGTAHDLFSITLREALPDLPDGAIRESAAIEPTTGLPQHLTVEVNLPVDDDVAWDRLADVYRLFQRNLLRMPPGERRAVRRATDRIDVVLSGEPEDLRRLLADARLLGLSD